ncbi:hypothetical protein L0U85_04295, partial [Glycomyces sp. L485]|uniref:hypothetical protein n=1 Tax=Glycomyces sp. L485 TaxID=2909235 RepID=UPI001F4B68C3
LSADVAADLGLDADADLKCAVLDEGASGVDVLAGVSAMKQYDLSGFVLVEGPSGYMVCAVTLD